MAKLVVLSGKMKERAFELIQDRVTVGRLADNFVCLDDHTISGHHAELTRDGDDYVLRDLNTTNGTCVNGRRVEKAHLSHGDTILMGQLQLEFLAAAKSSDRPLSPPPGKMINLSDTAPTVVPPVPVIRPSSAVRKKQGALKKLFQISLVFFGLVAIVALVALIIKIMRSP